eukprot:Nk52_evm8s210 gene=Nk52_evmTU8s210
MTTASYVEVNPKILAQRSEQELRECVYIPNGETSAGSNVNNTSTAYLNQMYAELEDTKMELQNEQGRRSSAESKLMFYKQQLENVNSELSMERQKTSQFDLETQVLRAQESRSSRLVRSFKEYFSKPSYFSQVSHSSSSSHPQSSSSSNTSSNTTSQHANGGMGSDPSLCDVDLYNYNSDGSAYKKSNARTAANGALKSYCQLEDIHEDEDNEGYVASRNGNGTSDGHGEDGGVGGISSEVFYSSGPLAWICKPVSFVTDSIRGCLGIEQKREYRGTGVHVAKYSCSSMDASSLGIGDGK